MYELISTAFLQTGEHSALIKLTRCEWWWLYISFWYF